MEFKLKNLQDVNKQHIGFAALIIAGIVIAIVAFAGTGRCSENKVGGNCDAFIYGTNH